MKPHTGLCNLTLMIDTCIDRCYAGVIETQPPQKSTKMQTIYSDLPFLQEWQIKADMTETQTEQH